MVENFLLEEFQKEWEGFLKDRGHELSKHKGIRCVLHSKDSAGKSYRWLLIVAQARSHTLTGSEAEDVRCHMAMARKNKQKAYVVIRFQKPEGKVVILPAERVLVKKRLLSRKGGLPWGSE